MSKQLQRIKARARELARSGRFIGWRPVAFELKFEPGFAEASDWIYSPSIAGWPLQRGEEADAISRLPKGST
jgi:hypothetical protein